jgi:uncharacterized membrane protein YphA (DoxX/SURF4 family)
MFSLNKIRKARVYGGKEKIGINFLRFSLGFIFLWFGVLKFFHGVSPAELIAGKTIEHLTLGLMKPQISLPLLALWECTIGLGLITGAWLRLTLILLYFQMAGTFLPLIFFPHETFCGSVFIPTLLGQYIIKNCVLISGAIVLGANSQSAANMASAETLMDPVHPLPVAEQEYLTIRN